jgi:predicted RNA binding protein YcfA (HicA-like mRNA interferase family)
MGLYEKLIAGRPLKRREAEKILKDLGFALSHIKGSHHHWVKDRQIFTLPVHSKDLKKWVTRELRKLYGKEKDKQI